jgi:hypothetical protein
MYAYMYVVSQWREEGENVAKRYYRSKRAPRSIRLYFQSSATGSTFSGEYLAWSLCTRMCTYNVAIGMLLSVIEFIYILQIFFFESLACSFMYEICTHSFTGGECWWAPLSIEVEFPRPQFVYLISSNRFFPILSVIFIFGKFVYVFCYFIVFDISIESAFFP